MGALRFLAQYVLSPLAPIIKYWSTPETAARVITEVLTNESDRTEVYYDEKGEPMAGSARVREPAFADRVVAETRDLLATIPMEMAPTVQLPTEGSAQEPHLVSANNRWRGSPPDGTPARDDQAAR